MRRDRVWRKIGKAAALAGIAAWSFGPIALLIIASVRPDREIFDPLQATFTLTWANYATLIDNWGSFFRGLVNSALITAGATVLATAAQQRWPAMPTRAIPATS